LESKLYNLKSKTKGRIYAIVLFYTASEFEIEYLRVDIPKPYFKKFTIIDGRRHQKEWVDELSDEKINKAHFTKYREEDNIKY